MEVALIVLAVVIVLFIIFAAIELVTGVVGTQDGVAHFAHLGGMLFGLILILFWKKKGQMYSEWQ